MKRKKIGSIRYKTFPYPEWSLILHLGLFAVWIITLSLLNIESGEVFKVIDVVLSVLFPIVIIFSIIYVNFYGWNSIIYFTTGKVITRRRRKVVEVDWEKVHDLCIVEPEILIPIAPLFKLKIISTENSIEIIFLLTNNIKEHFSEICTNKEICDKFSSVLEQLAKKYGN